MAKYDESDLMDAAQGAGLEELASRSFKKRYPGQSRSLPSDSASEDNKKRQDQEMISALTKFGRAMLPGQLGPLISEEIKNRRKPELLPKFKKGGKVSSASKRADGCAIKGKTRGRMI